MRSDWHILGNALLCSIACDLPPAGLGAIEHSEQAGVEVADGAVSEAGGADGGQYATMPGKAKSRRWRDGDSGRDKASGVASGVVEHPTR